MFFSLNSENGSSMNFPNTFMKPRISPAILPHDSTAEIGLTSQVYGMISENIPQIFKNTSVMRREWKK